MSPNTVCSCCAYPFTVSTRFGIRSARRCSTMSTCDHAAFTASFLLTSVFFVLSYVEHLHHRRVVEPESLPQGRHRISPCRVGRISKCNKCVPKQSTERWH